MIDWSAILGAVLGAAVPAGLAYLGIRGEVSKLRQERKFEREKGHEIAQTGYRKAYEEFLLSVEAAEVGPDSVISEGQLPNLRKRFWKVYFTGSTVARAADRYWSAEARRKGQAPDGERLEELLRAMRRETDAAS